MSTPDSELCLQVDVYEAKGLPVMNKLSDKSDPFVKISLDGKNVQKSAVLKKTLTPKWDERFTFKIDKMERSLIIKLYDWDALSANVFIGQICVPLRDIDGYPKTESWQRLMDKDNKKVAQGYILVTMQIAEASGPRRKRSFKEKIPQEDRSLILEMKNRDLGEDNLKLTQQLETMQRRVSSTSNTNIEQELQDSFESQEKLREALVTRRLQVEQLQQDIDRHKREFKAEKDRLTREASHHKNQYLFEHQAFMKYQKTCADGIQLALSKLEYYEDPNMKPMFRHKSDFQNCERCRKGFSLLGRWKKRCRRCGSVICKKCSSKSRVPNWTGNVSVCKNQGCPKMIEQGLDELSKLNDFNNRDNSKQLGDV